MRVLGLDVGDKRIGVAMSDSLGIIANALTVIVRKSEDAALEEITALARQHEVGRIVVGLPRSMDGSLGPQALSVQRFVETLEGHTELPVVTWDERLSTVAAQRALAEAGVKRKKMKKHVDAVAAAFVLQGYLDGMSK